MQTQTQTQSPPPRIAHQDAGFRYSPCRSVIYYPSTQDVNTYSQDPPEASLKLNFVHSYEGDTSKFGGSIKGKNIMWLLDGRMAFPAASLVIVLDIPLNKQSYFTGHSGDVTALTIHAERGVAASAEQGKICRILIWDTSILGSNDSSSEFAAEIELSTALAVRMVFGISFSCDCKYLVALCAAEKNSIHIFALESQEVLATMRLGHNEVFQMGFNPFLFTPTRTAYDDHVMQQSTGETPERSSCYTLVSCGGKQIKFWTFGEVIEQVDNLQDITGFKGRKLATPKNKQQWQRRYILEGTTAHASTAVDAPDITCFCPVYDGKNGSFVKSRIFTGTSSGAVYIWAQLEETNSLGGTFWQPRGKLLSIVTSVHDNHIVDLDYSGPASYATDEDGAEGEEDIDHNWVERIVSTGLDGVVNTWRINRLSKQSTKKTPFSHETCISVASLDSGIGQPRCVSFNLDCDAVVLGTTGNSICMLNGMAAEPGKKIDEGMIELRHLISGHQGKVRMLAMHPSKDVFATVSSDKSLRLWDAEQRRQIGITRGLGSPTAVTFSPEGSQVAVGNEAGELIVLTQANINRNFEVPLSARIGNNGWCILVRRSLAPKGKSPIKKEQKKVGGGLNVFVQNYEVTCLAYSPSGEFIAVACRDKYIHILSVANAFKRVAVCKGHSSYVTCMDFSTDGQYLQSNDTLRELLYFDVASGRVLNQASLARDIDWSTWTCLYGWPCQGIYNGSTGTIQDGEINSVARSNRGDLLVCGGSNTIDSSVKLFRFPSLAGSIPLVYGGHTSPALDVSFVASDQTVVSAGGNDLCVFQWEVLRPEIR
jgi:WD40 repeat protein